jgi:hypothetical protein
MSTPAEITSVMDWERLVGVTTNVLLDAEELHERVTAEPETADETDEEPEPDTDVLPEPGVDIEAELEAERRARLDYETDGRLDGDYDPEPGS